MRTTAAAFREGKVDSPDGEVQPNEEAEAEKSVLIEKERIQSGENMETEFPLRQLGISTEGEAEGAL